MRPSPNFDVTTSSLLTLAPSFPPFHLSIIVPLPLTCLQLLLFLAQCLRQTIYTVTGWIYLRNDWQVLLCLLPAPWLTQSYLQPWALFDSIKRFCLIKVCLEFGRRELIAWNEKHITNSSEMSLWHASSRIVDSNLLELKLCLHYILVHVIIILTGYYGRYN